MFLQVSAFICGMTWQYSSPESRPRGRKPDSAWSWLVSVVGTLAFTVIIGLPWTFGVFMPVLMDQFEASIEKLGKKYSDI